MPDYSKSKIYKLVSSNSEDIYIGSTIQSLSMRKASHKQAYNLHSQSKGRFISSIKIYECGGDIDIFLIEEYPCENKEQLHARERFHIENNKCVNKIIPTRTIKEYREDFKEHLKEKGKEWANNNKDKRKEIDKRYRDKNIEKRAQYYIINKEKINERNKEWKLNNKDKVREHDKKQKLKKSIK